ncbi:MAG: hypothetical protein AB8A35_04665 [Prochlorococcus sp.]
MSFDSHSLERLRELGRQLPKPLPSPDVQISENSPANKRRHRIETEEDPQALFKELMQVSPDGNIPTHLMARLREIETKQENKEQRERSSQQTTEIAQGINTPTNNAGKGKTTLPQRPRSTPGSEEESLYVAFGQLLLEDEDET